MSAKSVHDVLTRTRLTYHNEESLQEAIHEALTANGIPSVREVKLPGTLGRIDLMSGKIGIEVKVDGQTNSVTRQLMRYSRAPQIEELILVTTRAKHRDIPPALNGKPVHLVSLLTAGL